MDQNLNKLILAGFGAAAFYLGVTMFRMQRKIEEQHQIIVNGGGRKDEMSERINQLMLMQLEKTLNEEGIPRAAMSGGSGGAAMPSKFKHFQSPRLTLPLCFSRTTIHQSTTKKHHL